MPSLLRDILYGMGHLFVFSGSFEHKALNRVKEQRKEKFPKNTYEAFRSDFNKIGKDMQKAIDKYREMNV